MPVLSSPSQSPDLVSSSSSAMPECLDFFESVAAAATTSNSAAPRASDRSSGCNAAMETEDVGLELSLGLSVGRGSGKIVKPKAERVFPRSHPADASPPPASTESQREVTTAAQALLAIQNPQFLQRKGDEHSQLSRDQVWQALQKSNDAFAHAAACADGSRSFHGHTDTTASSLWSRRSASMQPNLPLKDASDLGSIPIRRSSSNGVPVSMIRHPSDVVSTPLSRQVSSIESLVERSPDMAAMSQQQQDLLELQKKRELQAQRRLEARKRRKFLLEEKQQKKWRHNNGLQHPGCNKQWAPIVEKCLSAVESSVKDFRLENERADLKPKLSDGRKNLKRAGGESKSGSDEDVTVNVETAPKAEHVEAESVHADDHGMMMSEVKADCENGNYRERSQDIKDGAVTARGRKSSHSNSSETVSMETKEDICSVQIDCGEREASSQKSWTENSSGGASAGGSSQKSGIESSTGGAGSGGSQPLSSVSVASSSLAYPASFSVYPDPGSTSASMNMQMAFSAPSYGQHPIQAGGGSSNMQNSMASSCPPSTFPPRSNSGSKYPHEGYQWLGAPGAQSTGGVSSMDSKICKENAEGKSAHDGAKATSEQAVGDVAPTMETATHIATIRTNVPITRQQSWSVGDRLVHQQGLGLSKQEFSTIHAEKLAPRTQGADLRRGLSWDMGSVKFGGVLHKHEIFSAESQQGSSSSILPSSDQLGLAEKQRQLRGSYPDLPWVSTTGSGPNGRTISGVMYISDGKRVRLVCSCHGKHMSPTEFVQHSGSDNLSNPERSIVVNAFPFLNQVATTPV